jgi:hypothetical protein
MLRTERTMNDLPSLLKLLVDQNHNIRIMSSYPKTLGHSGIRVLTELKRV